MLVRINPQVSRYSSDENHTYCPFGFIVDKTDVYFLLPELHVNDIFVESLQNLEIVDPRCSALWRVFPKISHPSLTYKGRKFNEITFIGIARIISEPDFLEEFWNDLQEHLEYILNVREKLRVESASLSNAC